MFFHCYRLEKSRRHLLEDQGMGEQLLGNNMHTACDPNVLTDITDGSEYKRQSSANI